MKQVRVAVYANTSGYYYYAELQRLLACGLKKLGARVAVSDQSRGFDPSASWHVITAPHEFFYVGAGRKMRRGPWPPGVIFYNSEPLDSPWFGLARRLLPKAHAVWDMDLRSSERLSREGWRSSHVPPGWVDDCDLFRPARTLLPFERRPNDLLFVGSRSDRREAFFSSAAPALSRHRRHIRLVDEKPFLRSNATRAMLSLARRSKIALNIHRRPSPYFEWHRMALHGIAQGALVLSEPASPAPPFIPGRDFVASALREMPEAIDYYLSSDQGRAEAARVAARGLRTYRSSCRLDEALREAAAALERPANPAARRAKLRAETAEDMLREIKAA